MSDTPGIRLDRSLPYVWVRDLDAAKVYYTDRLGFEVAYEARWDGEGRPAGLVGVERDGATLQLSVCQCDDQRHDGLAFFAIEMKSGVDPLYAEYSAKQVKMRHELKLHDYGAKDFTLEDPDGNWIEFFEMV